MNATLRLLLDALLVALASGVSIFGYRIYVVRNVRALGRTLTRAFDYHSKKEQQNG